MHKARILSADTDLESRRRYLLPIWIFDSGLVESRRLQIRNVLTVIHDSQWLGIESVLANESEVEHVSIFRENRGKSTKNYPVE